MASIHREIPIDAPAEVAWRAIRDVGAVDRLFAGVVAESRLDGGARVVTFANGMVLRELIVSVDDGARRVAYASVGGRTTHHNASLQVFDGDGGGCRVVWITDLLPDELAPAIESLVDQGAAAMRRALAGRTGWP